MMIFSSKGVWRRWRGVRRFKIYLGSKIYRMAIHWAWKLRKWGCQRLLLGWGTFSNTITDSYFLTYFLHCGLKFVHDCVIKEHDYLQGIPQIENHIALVALQNMLSSSKMVQNSVFCCSKGFLPGGKKCKHSCSLLSPLIFLCPGCLWIPS